MTQRNTMILGAVAAVAAIAAFWFLALSPKREQISKLDADIAAQETARDQATPRPPSTRRPSRTTRRTTPRRPRSARPSRPTTTSARCWCSSRAPAGDEVDFRLDQRRQRRLRRRGRRRRRADRDHTWRDHGPGTPDRGAAVHLRLHRQVLRPDGVPRAGRAVRRRPQREVGRVTGACLLVNSFSLKPDVSGFPNLRAEVGATSYVAPPMAAPGAAPPIRRSPGTPATAATPAAPSTPPHLRPRPQPSLEPSDEGSQRHLAPARRPAPPGRGRDPVGALAAVPLLLAKEPGGRPRRPRRAGGRVGDAGRRKTIVSIASTDTTEAQGHRREGQPVPGRRAAEGEDRDRRGRRRRDLRPRRRRRRPRAAAARPVGSAGTGGGRRADGADDAGRRPARAKTYDKYDLTVRFGASDSGDLKRMTLPRLQPLPKDELPALIYLGVSKDGKSAMFLLEKGVEAVGDGDCDPTPGGLRDPAPARRGDRVPRRRRRGRQRHRAVPAGPGQDPQGHDELRRHGVRELEGRPRAARPSRRGRRRAALPLRRGLGHGRARARGAEGNVAAATGSIR